MYLMKMFSDIIMKLYHISTTTYHDKWNRSFIGLGKMDIRRIAKIIDDYIDVTFYLRRDCNL